MESTNKAFQQYTQEERQLDIGELTLLQKQQAQQARRQHRLNMTKKPKGFKGEKAFIAKPGEIAFKDFVVGKPHYLVITLTNVSNSSISFNVLPLPQKIRNYFEVQYVPKGKISPGITNDIRFKFFPQINQDIFSEFTIQAETGNISYPIICTSRKTILRCEQPLVDFGRIIFGESKKVRLAIKNQGSLPSEFSILNRNNTEVGTSNSQEQMAIIMNLEFDKRGNIDANTEISIFFDFSPKQIGPFSLAVLLVAKNSLHSPPIHLVLQGQCVQVPVRVQRTIYDLEICLLGHVYRQKIKFYNKSEGPMSFKMVQPPETKKYFEFNPIIGYIQKQSALDVWVKFTADKDIVLYLNKFMKQKNVYHIPFQMSVKQQVLPVQFQLKFKITTDKVSIRPPELNFGKVFQGLSSKIQVQFENESQLPQEILLHPLKKNIYVENDQPLFKILPFQTLKTYIVYKSKRLQDSKPFKDEQYIGCRVITGEIATNKIDIHYTCEVIKSGLQITNNKIDLPALQVGQIAQAATSIKNNTNKQIIFEIFVPQFEACGLKVTPVVKTLLPKQQIQVNFQYHSFSKTMSVALLNEIALRKKPKPVEQKKVEEVAQKKQNKKEAKKETKLTKQQQEQLQLQQKRLEQQQRARKQKEEQARLQLEKNFNAQAQLIKMGGKFFNFGEAQHYQWLMPVYFKQKDYSDVSAEVNFIELTTTSILQVLKIDKSQIDFGEIAVGTRTVRQLIISNLGQKATLKKKSIPIFSCFNVLNSLKEVEPDRPFRAVIEFQPVEQQRFQHRLQFYTQKYSVSCKLKGKGVRPEVQREPENGLVTMGAILLDQSSQKTVKIKNICNFEVTFMLEKIGGGISNTNSGSAFSYIPSHGSIPPHGSIEIKAKFKPDRINQKYFEKIKIHVEEQRQAKYFYFIGSCFARQAYVTLYKPLVMPQDADVRKKVQYVFDSLRVKDEDTIFSPNNKTIILQFARVTEGAKDDKCFQRKLAIGSCRLLDPKLQKPTNFQFIMPKDDKFVCDNLKGAANAGTQTVVTFTYKPQQTDPLITSIPELAGMGQWRDLKIELKVSGGFVKPGAADAISLDLILRFYVNQL